MIPAPTCTHAQARRSQVGPPPSATLANKCGKPDRQTTTAFGPHRPPAQHLAIADEPEPDSGRNAGAGAGEWSEAMSARSSTSAARLGLLPTWMDSQDPGNTTPRRQVLEDLRRSSVPHSAASGSQRVAPTLDEHLNHMGLGWFHARLFAMLAILIAADGMEITVLAIVRTAVMQDFDISDWQFALVGSAIFAGMLMGCAVGGVASDAVGRRSSLIASCGLISLCGLISAAAQDMYTFAGFRFLTGLGIGAMVPVADALMLEWSPTKMRSFLVMLLAGVTFHVGAVCAGASGMALRQVFGGQKGSVWWRILIAMSALPALLALPLHYFYLPESLHWLVYNDRHQSAREQLRAATAVNGKEMLDVEGFLSARLFSCAGDDSLNGREEAGLLGPARIRELPRQLFGRDMRSTTVFLIFSFWTCGFVYNGFTFIFPFVCQTLYNSPMETGIHRMMLSSLADVAAVVVVMFLMDLPIMGRRGTILFGFATLTITSALTVTAKQDESTFVALNLILKMASSGPYTLLFVYAGELLPSSLRGSTMSLTSSAARIAAMLCPEILTALLSMHVDYIYLCFGLTSCAALTAAFFHTRETLGMPLLVHVSDLRTICDAQDRLPFVTRYLPILGRLGWDSTVHQYSRSASYVPVP